MAIQLPRRLATAALIASSVLIGACTRSASSPPTATPAGGTASPLTGQQATMEAVRSALLTQTAQAQGGGKPANTPTPGAPGAVSTATPSVGTPAGISLTAPAPTGTLPPIPTVVVPATYTLHEGEFPFCLARRYNRNPDDILAINGLPSNAIVSPGQTLSIPTSGTFPGPRALLSHPASYTVYGGETIYSIACQYGDVDPMGIAAANGLSSPYTLTPGTTIRIP
ncbi:MAG TPA: LysM peptidoglycan-binding domain-containing protein [Anaerolineales bacterium]|nr:LysM peptidoglycan-binding domain-containing protein [Anaerolineales bacterium]